MVKFAPLKVDVHCRENSTQYVNQVLLLPEIWRVIAGHLGPCEWARVAGMCKATWHLQLNAVTIRDRFGEVARSSITDEQYEQGNSCGAASITSCALR